MKTSAVTQVRRTMSKSQANRFMLAVLTVSVPVWTVAFNLGVYGEIFFEHTFYLWVASMVTLSASFFVPKNSTSIDNTARLILLLPTLWVGVSVATSNEVVLFWFGALVFGVALPYLFLIVATFANPELIETARLKLLGPLFFIVLTVGIGGYFIGVHNSAFMTCFDFEVSGNMVPDNCKPRSM